VSADRSGGLPRGDNGPIGGTAPSACTGFYWQLETALVLFDGHPTESDVPLDALDILDDRQRTDGWMLADH
jgi:hypothetical protein